MSIASALLRSAARTSARCTRSNSQPLRRHFAATALTRQAEAVQDSPKPKAFDYHTIEDLQGLSAQEILQEGETGKMRHFTGTSRHPTRRVSFTHILLPV